MYYKEILKYSFFLLALLLSTLVMEAQTVQVEVDKNEMTQDETLRLTYTYNGMWEKFDPPAFDDFRLMDAPMPSYTTVRINRELILRSSYTFLLQPKRTGSLKIGPASVLANGKRLESGAITIKVNPSARGRAMKDLFLKAELSKKEIAEGEGVRVTYKLYFKNMRLDRANPVNVPSFAGFWQEDVEIGQFGEARVEMIDGEQYYVSVRKEAVLFPQKSGTLTINPMEVECIGAREEAMEELDPFFREFPWGRVRNYKPFRAIVRSDSLQLKVNPLPPNPHQVPFSGFVGNATLSAQTNADSLHAGEALNYTLTLGGAGNITLVQPFEVKLANADVFKPEVEDRLAPENNTLTGTRRFSYTVIPKEEGTLNIPEYSFVYYDPDKKEYVVVRTNPIEVKVLPPPAGTDTGTADEEAENKADAMEIPAIVWWGLGGGALLALGLLLFIRSRGKGPERETLYSPGNKGAAREDTIDAVHDEREQAYDRAHEYYRQATQESDPAAFYSLLSRSVDRYLYSVTGKSRAERLGNSIEACLKEKGYTEDTIEAIMEFKSTIEAKQYGWHGMELDGAARDTLLKDWDELLRKEIN